MWKVMKRNIGLLVVLLLILVYGVYHFRLPCPTVSESRYQIHHDNNKRQFDRTEPLIFVGGMPRSGTTLVRSILDAHSLIRCGEETRVVPRILQMRQQWKRSAKETVRLEEAGVTDEVLNEAISSFILEIIVKHGASAERLCDKDPFTLKSATYLATLFPNAKFIFVIRDGRATVHSVINRKVTITGFDLTSYRQCLERWNTAVHTMNNQCELLGPEKCLPVFYEQLVLRPKESIEKILKFLDIPWENSVLHHEDQINKPGGISLSKVERSSDQVIKPINLEALTKWVGNLPEDVVEDMPNIAPMLSFFGYDPLANPPHYGDPDPIVANNTLKIHRDTDARKMRSAEILSRDKEVFESRRRGG